VVQNLKISVAQLMEFQDSAWSLGRGGGTSSGGRMCLLDSRSSVSIPHIFWNPAHYFLLNKEGVKKIVEITPTPV
jgi:hypothetical protein